MDAGGRAVVARSVLDLLAPLRERERCIAITQHLLAHALRHCREDFFGDVGAVLRSLASDLGEVASVRAVLDLAQRAAPVRVIRAKLLLQRRESVAQARVADVELLELAHAALHVRVELRRGLLLHPEEVLLVQHFGPIEGLVDVVEDLLDIDLVPVRLCRLERHVSGG